MNKPSDDQVIAKPGKDDDDKKGEESSQLNSPKLDEKTGKPTQDAVSSFKQAHGIAKKIYDRAKEGRLKTAAVIADKYGGSPPFKNEDMRKTAQSWRNNYSTNPLGSIVDRSTPQLTDPIKRAECLTYSALPPDRDKASEKTAHFRKRFTKLIRSWSGFNSLIGQIAQENYLYGNAAPGWIDDDWRPKAWRFDEAFLPDGTGQHASLAQFVIYRQPMLLHDFLKKIEDKEVADAAGYDWEGCIKAANESSGLRSDADSSQLEQVDAVREGGSLGFTYDGETKVVWLFHLLVREYNGGVNLWTTSQKGGHGIRFVEKLHETMEDACAFFTLQEGNTKFYGSKGAGRMLTNLHIALDRHRNLGADKVYVDGLPIFRVKSKDMNTVQMVVRSPFIFVNGEVEMQEEKIKFDYNAHEYLDKAMSGQMEAIAGAFIPPHLDNSGSSRTKIEAAQKAERELAVKDGVLGRFLGQFSDLMSGMQRKVFKPDNLKEAIRLFEENKEKKAGGFRIIGRKIWNWLKDVTGDTNKNAKPEEESMIADADAVQCIVDLLSDGLTIEDIAELALSPAGNNIEQQPEEQDQKTVAFVETKQGNPFYNQRELQRLQANKVIGEDRANQILLPEQEDPNVEAVAMRQQITEWLNMLDGEAMPVASTDHHGIHRKVLQPKMEPVMQMIATAPTPEITQFAKLALQHYADHLASDLTATPEAKIQEEQGIKDWQKAIVEADKKLAALAAQAQAAGVQGGAAALPQQVQGAPMQATGPNGALEGTEGDLERDQLRADAMLRLEDQKIKHRELDIREKALTSKEESEAGKMAVDIMQDTATQAAEAAKQGRLEADKEMREQAALQNPNAPTI